MLWSLLHKAAPQYAAGDKDSQHKEAPRRAAAAPQSSVRNDQQLIRGTWLEDFVSMPASQQMMTIPETPLCCAAVDDGSID